MKCFCTFFGHSGPQFLSLMNTKNQPNGKKKNDFPYCPFRMDSIAFKIIILYIIQSNALYEHC